ncbi:adenylate kinase 9-like [Diorhabda sublineata]|uniref:adenylate kinase 9-like n=1 Tax=Diorhabda sublineata TaxID=1163346 RepID=UPI0024E184DC|nr:adenylate kinase 9-like [Diorhabda sublineata]
MRIAVSGPPKCGKTILAKRIQREYGMKIVSRGQAIRFVLTILPLSNLATNLETILRRGWEPTDEMVVRCVEAATIDPWGVTQGNSNIFGFHLLQKNSCSVPNKR